MWCILWYGTKSKGKHQAVSGGTWLWGWFKDNCDCNVRNYGCGGIECQKDVRKVWNWQKIGIFSLFVKVPVNR